MGILNIFRRKESTASLAKDRLQLVIAHERTNRAGPAYLPMMKQDIVNVIRKYVPITEEEVVVNMESDGNCDVLELNISLPQVASARSPGKK
ncbi:MAG: cell division topological specificity factor MinE [Gammaproteobacteria bacterium]|nr:cell division topological specificity factor MinE [Gammaproteobacteria bacterium]